jgi:hypothetical protein
MACSNSSVNSFAPVYRELDGCPARRIGSITEPSRPMAILRASFFNGAVRQNAIGGFDVSYAKVTISDGHARLLAPLRPCNFAAL